MICSTTYRTVLSLAGSAIMTLGTFGMLKAQAPWDAPRTAFVGYHDADLRHPAGTARLYGRIHKAADRVCGEVPPGDLNARRVHRLCVDEAVARAVSYIDSPTLTALHSATISRWQAAAERHVKPEA